MQRMWMEVASCGGELMNLKEAKNGLIRMV